MVAVLKKGVPRLFYHSNEGKELVGIAESQGGLSGSDRRQRKVRLVDSKGNQPMETPVTWPRSSDKETRGSWPAGDICRGFGAGRFLRCFGRIFSFNKH